MPQVKELPLFHFLAFVLFLARSKPKIQFLGLSLLRNLTETLATQAIKFAFALGKETLSAAPRGWGEWARSERKKKGQ